MAEFTKQAIRNSFIKLLNEKPLKKISVRDIVDDCNINRNTFYYHFQDIPQLTESIIKEDTERFIQKYSTIGTIEECLEAVASFALENKQAVLHIYRSVSRDVYEHYQWRICDYAAGAYLESLLKDRNISETDRKYLTDYVKCVLFGLIIGWLEGGMQKDMVQFIHRICELKLGSLEEIIDNCEKNPGSMSSVR